MAGDDVVLQADTEEILISFRSLVPFEPPSGPVIKTLTVPTTSIHEVGLERWTTEWVFMDVTGAVTNHGNLYMEDFELAAAQVENRGRLELCDMEVETDLLNQGTLITWAADLEGNVTCSEGALWRVGAWADLWKYDDGSGGNLTNRGRLWFYGSSRLTAEGSLNNVAPGTVQGAASSIQVFGGFANEGLVRSYGGDLAIHCDGSAFSNADSGEVTNMAGTTLSILADAMNQRGTITVRADGAVNLAGADLVNQPGATIHLLGGTLSAPNITHHDGAVFEGFGSIDLPADAGGFGSLTNQGHMEFVADTRLVGHLDNQAGATLTGRNGDLAVLGNLTNNGEIVWVNGGVYCEGTWTGAGALTLTGDEGKAVNGTLDIAPGGALTVTGAGPASLYADIDWAGAMTVGDGATAVCLGTLGGAVDALTIAGGTTPTGTLDLTQNNLVVDYDPGANPFGDVEAWVVSGYGGGTWDGTGITSSTAASDGMPTALAVGDNADPLLGLADLEGEPLDPDGSDVLVRFTWYGDVNFDGVVDAADYAVMDQSWNGGSQSPAGGGAWRWAAGDVNYDGTVDAADYALIDQVWNTYGGQTLDAGAPAPLDGTAPEPATLALLALGAGALLARRRP